MAKKRANGEGNIRKRSDGRWEGRYTAGYNPQTGKRIIKNVLGKTQAEVKAKLAKALEDSKELDIVRTDEYTVAEWLRLWYELYAEPNVRPTTAASYRRNIGLHVIPHIGDIKLNRLTSRELQKFYKDLLENGRLREAQKEKNPGLSNSTVRGIHMMLHNALDRAVRERLILRNPTEDCIIPKLEKKEMKILRPEDIKAYLAAAERRGVLPMFLSRAGQRRSQRRNGGLAVGRLGYRAAHHFREQAGSEPTGRRDRGEPAKDRDLQSSHLHPTGGGGSIGRGTPEAPGQPVYVPVP